MHEEVVRGTFGDLLIWLEQKGNVKGEIVLVVGGLPK